MKMHEVENLFFDYEEKKHEFLQNVQKYFIERKFHPYVWIDDEHRLRIKNKYHRKIQDFCENNERIVFIETVRQFAEENKLNMRFILDLGETDTSLPPDIETQWSTEIILEVKR